MSGPIRDGGPAFPRTKDADANSWEEPQHGMTLRDWFAGQALAGMLAAGSAWQNDDNAGVDAYEFADAMLKAREAKS